MRNFTKMTHEEKEQVLTDIQEKTNAASIILIMADTQIPCAMHTAGFGCVGGHTSAVGIRNVDPRFAVATMVEVMVNMIISSGQNVDLLPEMVENIIESYKTVE